MPRRRRHSTAQAPPFVQRLVVDPRHLKRVPGVTAEHWHHKRHVAVHRIAGYPQTPSRAQLANQLRKPRQPGPGGFAFTGEGVGRELRRHAEEGHADSRRRAIRPC